MTEESPRTDAAEYHYARFMEHLGLEPDSSEHLEDTPRRVTEAFRNELFSGIDKDPERHLDTTFKDAGQYEGDAGWVVEDNIQIQSMCAHHFLPFRGVAHVGYLPTTEVVGLSKLARVAQEYARRPQVQEKLTNQISNAIHENLDPRATMVVIIAEHECMSCRGVKEPYSTTRTAAIRGQAREDPAMKSEFYRLLNATVDQTR